MLQRRFCLWVDGLMDNSESMPYYPFPKEQFGEYDALGLWRLVYKVNVNYKYIICQEKLNSI